MAKDDGQETKTEDSWNWLLFVALGVVLGGAALYVGVLVAGTESRFGPLGDSMAPAAALLSFLAIVAALRSVELQRKELQEQRLELRETRKELAAQAKHLADAAVAQNRLAAAEEALAVAQVRTAKAQERTEEWQSDLVIAQLLLAQSTLIQSAEASSSDRDRIAGKVLDRVNQHLNLVADKLSDQVKDDVTND